MDDVFDYIENSPLKSKRDKIANGIMDAISDNSISKGDPIPSVNKFMQRLGVARMTVVKALNVLKERGIIVSEDKVGYFVRDVNVKRELKVFLFLTGFYSYHETLYNNIVDNINDPTITIDLYFHHCNPKIFKSVLLENIGSYGLYIITGFEGPQMESLLARIPPSKLLQIIRPPVLNGVSSITQDFYSGLKKSLGALKDKLAKYERFVLAFPDKKGHPEEIRQAFIEYCNEIGMEYQIEKKVSRESITKGCAYWVIEDSDLISLIKVGEEMGFRIGSDIGILSYNETPMKEIIRNGITVISVDFVELGKSIARFISSPKPTVELFAPEVIIRKSL